MRKGAYAIIINDEKEILLTKKKDVYILPGGKHDEGEDDEKCIKRELGEEICIPENDITIGHHYKDSIGATPHSKTEILCKTYFVTIKDESAVKAGREISEVLRTREFQNHNLSEITREIIEALQADTLI